MTDELGSGDRLVAGNRSTYATAVLYRKTMRLMKLQEALSKNFMSQKQRKLR